MRLRNKNSDENCHETAYGAKVEEKPPCAQNTNEEIGSLNCKEDHEEAVGDQACVYNSL